MFDSGEALMGWLSREKVDCPMCGAQAWGVLDPDWALTNQRTSREMPLLPAYCRGCGYVAWFMRGR